MMAVMKRLWFVPVLVAYVALVAFAISQHAPWFDEAQSWLIARDCSVGDLFSGVLRYEGHPVLWYLILKFAMLCHLPYEAIGVISGVIATLGVALLLWKAPFPRWLTILLPFTFFLGYQYAVIARSYVLLPLALFAIASLAPRKWEKPIWWSVLMILLANISIHAFVIAGGLMAIHGVEFIRRWTTLESKARVRQIIGMTMYTIVSLGVLIMLWPARDFGGATWLNGAFPFSVVWNATMEAIDGAYFGLPVLTTVFLIVSCYWFWKTRTLVTFLVLGLPVVIVFLVLRLNEHHYGILFLIWLFTLWRSMEAFLDARRRGDADPSLQMAFRIMFAFTALLVIRQVVWTGQSVVNEASQPYCGAEAAAKFIKAHDLTRYPIGGVHYKVASLQPYFDKSIFVNFPNEHGRSYVEWRKSVFVGNDVFNANNCFESPCSVLVWSVESNSPEVPWTQPGFLSHLPDGWCCIGYFAGQQTFENKLPCHFDIAVLATKKLADRLGLPAVEFDGASKGEKPIPLSAQSGDLTEWAQTYLAFGSILRKIDPKGAAQLFQNVLDIPLPKIDSADSPMEAGRRAMAMLGAKANAHNNIGVMLIATSPKQAMEHFEAAMRVNPDDPNICMNVAILLANDKKHSEAIAVLRHALKSQPNNRRLEGLLREIASAIAAGDAEKRGDAKETKHVVDPKSEKQEKPR